jgi:cytochrome c oxidase cbb3-type subunit I
MNESGKSILDRSFRMLAVFFLYSGTAWLLVGTLIAVLAASKLVLPTFLSQCDWFAYGRLKPAAANALVYGWGGNLIFGSTLWMLARLSWAEIPFPGVAAISGMAWNGALTIGILGILAGHGTPFELLEMPPYVSLFLYASFLVLATWSIIVFHSRLERETYVSQWYLLGAVFWFGLTFFLANMGLFWEPVRGTIQTVVASWFAQNLIWLWLVPTAFGTAYYLVPKLLGVSVKGYSLAIYGFSTLALIAPWAGLIHLRGGPVPEWIPSMGSVMAVAMFFPVTIFAGNVLGTACSNLQRIWENFTLRFIVAGTLLFTVCVYLESLLALPTLAEVTQFSLLGNFQFIYVVHGLFAMCAFGLSYHWLPLLFGGQRPPELLVSTHFWIALSGVTLSLASSVWGGFAGGAITNMGNGDWHASLLPFHAMSITAESLLFLSAIFFGLNLYWVIGCPLNACCPLAEKETGPTLVEDPADNPDDELSEDELAAKKSMRLTMITFVLAVILVAFFAGVVFSLIL